MASVKHLKRDLNYVMGDIIEAAYIHQIARENKQRNRHEREGVDTAKKLLRHHAWDHGRIDKHKADQCGG